MRRLGIAGSLLLALLLLGPVGARGASLGTERIGSFAEPIYLTSDPGNPDRLFLVERRGEIVLIENGVPKTFANLSEEVGCEGSCSGERGLLSIALAPDFDRSGRLFADYAESPEPGAIHIVELRASGNSAPLSTLRPVLKIEHPSYPNDYGGQLQFGPEGDLFISTGDGGGSDDVEHNAQSLEGPLGKILRIEPGPDGVEPYGIPASNPFVGVEGADEAIWSYGLRNPFRFSFDRATGDLWIGDEGESAWEEVDRAPAPELGRGANYGWNCREGFEEGPLTSPDPECAKTLRSEFTDPVFAYPHEPQGEGAWGEAIIGGYVARGPAAGALAGRYLYGDHGTGAIRSFLPSNPKGTDRPENVTVKDLYSFGEDSCGRLYALSGEGPVYRLLPAEAKPCPAPAQAQPEPTPPLPSYVGVRAVSRRVLRHRRALVIAWVSPCEESRRGNPITLWRGPHRIGTRHLDWVCSARFRPRIDRRSGFRATIREQDGFLGGISRKLTLRPWRRPRHGRRRHPRQRARPQ